MELFDLPFSLKDIPKPSKKDYNKLMINKLEDYLGRLRWAGYHHLEPKDKHQKPTT